MPVSESSAPVIEYDLGAQLADLDAATDAAKTAMGAALDSAAAQNRDLTDGENHALGRLKAGIDGAADTARQLEQHDIHQRSLANAQAFERLGMKPATPTLPYGEGVQGREPDMYRPSVERGSEDPSFLADVLAQASGDHDAAERIRRHQVFEHQRDNTLANFPGVAVPRYLGGAGLNEKGTEGRPVADAIGSMPLMNRRQLRIPRETTTPTVAVQTAENANVDETDMATDELELDVATIAGSQQVSFQAADFGDADRWIIASLMRQVDEGLDKQILVGTGSDGQFDGLSLDATIPTGSRVDKDQSSATAAHVREQIGKLMQLVHVNRGHSANLIIMHPRRYWFFAARHDVDNLPGAEFGARSFPAWIDLPARQPDMPVGATGASMFGVPVVASGHIATTSGAGSEDYVFALRTADYALYEAPTMTVRGFANGTAANAASTGINTLTHTLVVYKYAAGGLVNSAGAARLEGTVVSTEL